MTHNQVTHNNAAQSWRFIRNIALFIGLAFASQSLTGCGSTSLLSFANASTNDDALPAPEVLSKPIAFTPVIGAPPQVSSQLTSALTVSATKRKIPIFDSKGNKNAKADYSLHGFLVASPDQKGTKLSYIWDIRDKAGKRQYRIRGEEMVAGKKSKDPWKNITPQAINAIAEQTTAKLAAWLPKQNKGAPAVRAIPQNVASNAAATTGSIRKTPLKKGVVYAMVPRVKGAPGDGQVSLSRALQKQLASQGIKLTNKASSATYQVVGSVNLGKPASGQQNIAIQWNVVDPKGNPLGTVTQQNSIPAGSLNRKWGNTADAAAAAAAAGIVKLLPKSR